MDKVLFFFFFFFIHILKQLVVAIHMYYLISTLLKYFISTYLTVYIVKCNYIYVIHGFENNTFFSIWETDYKSHFDFLLSPYCVNVLLLSYCELYVSACNLIFNWKLQFLQSKQWPPKVDSCL